MWDEQTTADGGVDARGLIDALERVLPGRVLWHAVDTSDYSHDRSHHRWAPAVAVVRATTTDDVAAAVRVCRAAGVPVIARGTGTGLEGGANALPGEADPITGVVPSRSRVVVIEWPHR